MNLWSLYNVPLFGQKLTILQVIWVQIWSSMYLKRIVYHFINFEMAQNVF